MEQQCEQQISSLTHALSSLALSRQSAQSELNDLVGAQAELKCVVDDLRASSDLDGGKRATLESELADVAGQITRKERELAKVTPKWESQRAKESAEKRKAHEAQTQLNALFSKQGRMSRFKTKAERDRFLNQDMASVQEYIESRAGALEKTKGELEASKESLKEVEERIEEAYETNEDGKTRLKDLADQTTKLKDEHSEVTEKRKEFWREETKLSSLVNRAADERRSAENNLASMMDKVRC